MRVFPVFYLTPEVERMIVMLFLSASIHALVLFSVDFVAPEGTRFANITLDVILVQKSTEEKPKDADYFAQVSQDGGGDSPDRERPATPTIAPFAGQQAELVVTPPEPQEAMVSQQMTIKQLTVDRPSTHEVAQLDNTISPDEPGKQGESLENDTLMIDGIPASTLRMNISTNIASIQAEIDEISNNLAKRPRKSFINSRTTEYRFAYYMDAWRRKAERVGTLNYPERARRQKISGNVLLTVAINADGTIHEVTVDESSGYKILDDAALQIVHLAAPFAPFSENIRKDTDILYITRTWKFIDESLKVVPK